MKKSLVLVGMMVAGALYASDAAAQHKAPNQQPPQAGEAPAPAGAAATLGTIKLPKGVTADGKPLVTLTTELDDLEVYYSTDNTFPDRFANRYTAPFVLPEGANNLMVITYRNGRAMGKTIRMTTEEINGRLGGKKLGY